MQKVDLDKRLRNALRIDIENHTNVSACRGLDAFNCSESLYLLKSLLSELTDEQINDEIKIRDINIKKGNNNIIENYYTNLELLVLRRLKGEILQSFPNSFSIDF